MERVLRDTRAQIFATFIGADGAAANVTTPKVTIVRDSDGATVVDDQPAADETPTGQISFTLTPAQIPEVDLLRATWSGTLGASTVQVETEVEVVGGHLCSLEAINAALPSNTQANTAELAEAREWAERWLEDACGVAFRRRYGRDSLKGGASKDLLLSRPRTLALRSLSIDDTELTADELAVLNFSSVGVVSRSAVWPDGADVDVAYEHGWRSPPAPVTRAAIRLARYFLIEDPSNFDERATSITTEEASYSLVTPAVRGAVTPIPEVNAVIAEYGYPVSVG